MVFGDIETEEIRVERGLKQGCILSSLLFAFHIRQLRIRLNDPGLGIRTAFETITKIFFADDMVLMADTREGLQGLLEIAGSFVNSQTKWI